MAPIKGMNDEVVFGTYSSLKDVEMTIFHSRLASAGELHVDNVQPFVSKDGSFAFAHNGTVRDAELNPLAIAAGVEPENHWSDSRLLMAILEQVGPKMRRRILQSIHGSRFVLYYHGIGRVELYGDFSENKGLITNECGVGGTDVVVLDGRLRVIEGKLGVKHRNTYIHHLPRWLARDEDVDEVFTWIDKKWK
jgi:hypothetical protein